MLSAQRLSHLNKMKASVIGALAGNRQSTRVAGGRDSELVTLTW